MTTPLTPLGRFPSRGAADEHDRRSRRSLLRAALGAPTLALGSTLGLAAGCRADPPALALATPGSLRVTTHTEGLAFPWGLAFLPDGGSLVTEKAGRLRRVAPDGRLQAEPIAGLPTVAFEGQGGLLDVALDPDFASNRLVYLSYAEAGSGAESGLIGTTVARGQLSPDQRRLSDLQVVFRQQPKKEGAAHFGSRLVFGRDGMLFVTLGDRQKRNYRMEAQDLGSHLGKVVRIRPDGSVPPDNPFVGRTGARPEIFSLGHRNVQGACLHPETGELWTCEHGPQGGDEVNRTLPGRNYGWPVITHGREYGTGLSIGEGTAKAGMEQPLTFWVPSIGISGLAFGTSAALGSWRGSAFVGGLRGRALWRLSLKGNQVVAREALLTDLDERIRDVRLGPDGSLYLLTDSDQARILRVQRA